MEKEKENLGTQKEETETSTIELLTEEIRKLKETTVSKKDYDSIKEDNRKLVEALTYNQGQKENIDYEAEIAKDKKALSEFNGRNLDYVKLVLKLRKDVIASGKGDPALPNGPKAVIDSNDKEKLETIFEGLEDMVERSGNNPDVFDGLYQGEVQANPMCETRYLNSLKNKK